MESLKRSEIDTTEGRTWLRGILREQKVTVTFNKVNGDERVMTCTLSPNLIPEQFKPSEKDDQANQQSDNIEMERTSLAVYDVNAKGWRSFRWANVKKVEFTLGEQNG